MRRFLTAPVRASVAVAVVTVLALSACTEGASPGSTGGAPSIANSSGANLPDPKTIAGPSTAGSVPEVVPLDGVSTPRLPVKVTDHRGRPVTVTDASRILALDIYGTLADTVIALGLGDRIVGRGSSTTAASLASLPVVTENGHQLNAEAILRLRPTVVLTDTSIGPLAVQQQLAAAKVPVVFFDPQRTLASTGALIRAVADALGVDESGARLSARVDAEVAAGQAKIAAMAPGDASRRLRMVFLYVRGTAGVFFVMGAGSGASELIAGLHGIDVAAEAGLKGIKPANGEALLATNPDLILVMTDGLKSTGGVDGLLARPGVGQTTAGRAKRVVDMADGQVLSFGPGSAAVLLSLARAVYDPAGAH
ncbi:hemin ABC transporter substrate-binding protein [Gryllotalpicola reticulitermitis]|uniref:Hemin ABC transporter substrate-binding protein n=1 Tax=Gryllotalpicola reticulitermitis TaxID=1184153 RepID=A0ABV8Q8M5_9MICO